MTALAEEVAPVVADEPVSEPGSDLDEVLWQAWKALDLPEGYRAEIIEGAIEVSPTDRRRHTVLIGRLRRALDAHLANSGYAVHHDGNVIHRHKSWIPDLFVAPRRPRRDPRRGGPRRRRLRRQDGHRGHLARPSQPSAGPCPQAA
ncbi:Uma2 family endonuclease [Streptomyces mexicanus]|uniref:Uma2 family endonuclease n=1 Tax=Streptomyces mexicanus TaxID=178566 RepID=UPI0031E560E0